jgi:hypothetical protein
VRCGEGANESPSAIIPRQTLAAPVFASSGLWHAADRPAARDDGLKAKANGPAWAGPSFRHRNDRRFRPTCPRTRNSSDHPPATRAPASVGFSGKVIVRDGDAIIVKRIGPARSFFSS